MVDATTTTDTHTKSVPGVSIYRELVGDGTTRVAVRAISRDNESLGLDLFGLRLDTQWGGGTLPTPGVLSTTMDTGSTIPPPILVSIADPITDGTGGRVTVNGDNLLFTYTGSDTDTPGGAVATTTTCLTGCYNVGDERPDTTPTTLWGWFLHLRASVDTVTGNTIPPVAQLLTGGDTTMGWDTTSTPQHATNYQGTYFASLVIFLPFFLVFSTNLIFVFCASICVSRSLGMWCG